MEHFLVGVIVDEPKLSLVEKALATYRTNNKAKWDWCNVCQEETTIRKYAIPSASIEDNTFIKIKDLYKGLVPSQLFWAFLIWDKWFEKGDIKKRHEFSFLTEKSIVDYEEAWNAIVKGPEIQEKYIAIVDCRIMD